MVGKIGMHECEKNKQNIIVLAVYAVVVVIMHCRLTLVSDDFVRIQNTTRGLGELFKYYWGYNGRVTTDVISEILVRHFTIWKVINVFAYLASAIILYKIININSAVIMGICCLLNVMFPFNYWDSAGYVSTTANYFYPAVLFLLLVLNNRRLVGNNQISIPVYVGSVLGIIYMGFSTQFIITAFLFLLWQFVFCLYIRTEKRIILAVAILLGISALMVVLMWISPGFQYRRIDSSETIYWLPQYFEWSFWKKLIEGGSTTIATLVFFNNKYVGLLSILFAILGAIHIYDIKNNKLVLILSFLPLLIMTLYSTIGYEKFVTFYEYSCGMPDICLSRNRIGGIIVILGVATMVSAFIVVTIVLVKDLYMKCSIIMLSTLGIISRVIMGYSGTIYASSFRTFTLCIFCLMIVIVDVIGVIFEKCKNNLIHYAIFAIIIAMQIA